MRGNVLAGPKSPLWSCSCDTDGKWASRICCRESGKSAPQRIANAARAAVKRSGGGGGGGTKSKGDDLAEFEQELLAEVRSRIKGASVVPSGPTSRWSSTVESDDSNGSEEQSTVATRKRLGSEIQGLRKLLGPDHVEVTKRRAELESFRQQRPLHTTILDGQRRLEKATKKVALRRKKLAEAEEQMHMAHAKRDKGQTELLRQFHGADLPLEDAGPSLASVKDALDRFFHIASADEAGSAAKQLLEVAKNELTALECSLKSSMGVAQDGLEAMDAANEPGTDDTEVWTNDLVGVVGKERPREGPLEDHEAHQRVWMAVVTEEGLTRRHRQVS